MLKLWNELIYKLFTGNWQFPSLLFQFSILHSPFSINFYFCRMNRMRYFLFLTLNFLALMVNAQDFKVIEETKDYILKECDSVYYYSHGLPPKDDFVIDTTKIHKVNGVLKLPMDNGKEMVFKDGVADRWENGKYAGPKDLLDEYYSKNLKMYAIIQYESCVPIYLINQQNNEIDTA